MYKKIYKKGVKQNMNTQIFFSNQRKQFNVPYHPDIAERIESLNDSDGKRINKTALLKYALTLYFNDYQAGKVKPSKTIRKCETGRKPRYCASIEVDYLETFDQITQSLKNEVKNDPKLPKKATTYTKTKVLEEVLEYWLKKEGYKYE